MENKASGVKRTISERTISEDLSIEPEAKRKKFASLAQQQNIDDSVEKYMEHEPISRYGPGSDMKLRKELTEAENANRAWSLEAERLRVTNEHLSLDNDDLRDENSRLRRETSNDDEHIQQFKRRLKILERDAREHERIARVDIDDLTGELAKSNDVAHQWKRKCEELMAGYDKLKQAEPNRKLQRWI